MATPSQTVRAASGSGATAVVVVGAVVSGAASDVVVGSEGAVEVVDEETAACPLQAASMTAMTMGMVYRSRMVSWGSRARKIP